MAVDNPPQTNRKAGPIAAAIVAAIAIVAPLTMTSEGKKNVAYSDRISGTHPATSCFGHTGREVRVGVRYTDAQCEVQLSGDMTRHAQGVYDCTPQIADNIRAFAAATDLAFNLGVHAYCHSTAARRFALRDWAGGCDALGSYFTVNGRRVSGYIKAGGQVRAGLVTRRDRERRLCLTGRYE